MDCSCHKCSGACSHKPGWFLPKEAEKAAKLLDMTLKAFFDKYLGVDWWESSKDIFVLAPANTRMTAGNEYPSDPKGVCVFFKEGKCQIHDAKPHECGAYIHDDTSATVNARHKAIADAWNTDENQAQIETLLGRKPQSEEYYASFMGLW